MPRVLYCILLVLALPQAAAAGDALGVPAEPLVAGSGALERAAPPLVPARGLDLGIEDAQIGVAQEARDAGQDTKLTGCLVTSAPTRRTPIVGSPSALRFSRAAGSEPWRGRTTSRTRPLATSSKS